MISLIKTLETFNTISLREMKELSLMDRQESKYVIQRADICQFLLGLNKDYRILSINDKKISTYKNEYYDTQNLDFYREHLIEKPDITKIRIRNYVDSKISFIEIKKKNNIGRSSKNRREFKGELPMALDKKDLSYLKDKGYENESILVSTLSVFYKRITLVSIKLKEKVTLDLHLRFADKTDSINFDDICIVEVKQLDKAASPIFEKLKAIQNINETISKYCLGIYSLRPNPTHNLFQSKILDFNQFRNRTW